jgi:2',3'-cyclic-nucleotide 2'-phosphodiesterase (5'-nucleotidase family)
MRFGPAILLLTGLWASCAAPPPVQFSHSQYRLGPELAIGRDARTDSLIAPYKRKFDAEMQEIIGELGEPMTKSQPESTLGNWLADVLLTESQAASREIIDVAVLNYHGIRIPSLPAGPIPVGRVYELLPFDNMLVLVALDSALLARFVQTMGEKGGWPCSAGLRYHLNEREAGDIRIHDEVLRSGRTYRVVMPDFVADGGDGCGFLAPLPREPLGILLRDAVIRHLRGESQSGRVARARLDGRIHRIQ